MFLLFLRHLLCTRLDLNSWYSFLCFLNSGITSLCLVYWVLGIKPRASSMLGKHFTNLAISLVQDPYLFGKTVILVSVLAGAIKYPTKNNLKERVYFCSVWGYNSILFLRCTAYHHYLQLAHMQQDTEASYSCPTITQDLLASLSLFSLSLCSFWYPLYSQFSLSLL